MKFAHLTFNKVLIVDSVENKNYIIVWVGVINYAIFVLASCFVQSYIIQVMLSTITSE